MPKALAAAPASATPTRELREIARQLTRIADALESLALIDAAKRDL